MRHAQTDEAWERNLKKSESRCLKYKQRLEQERQEHRDAIKNLRSSFRERLDVEVCSAVKAAVKEEKRRSKGSLTAQKKEAEKREEALKNKIAEQERELQLYRDANKGRSKKEGLKNTSSGNGLLCGSSCQTDPEKGKEKKKGKRKGSQGFGRKPHTELAAEDEIHELPGDERQCLCSAPVRETGLFEESEEIRFEVCIRRVRNRRKIYSKTCDCSKQMITTPAPLRALPKSKYSDDFFLEALLAKYRHQIPLNVFIKQLSDHGLKNVNASTLCGGIERIDKFLRPLFEALVIESKQAAHWHSDESRLAVFIPRSDGKKSYNHALFQHASSRTVIFELRPTREAKHLEKYFKGLEGIVNSDRASIYKKLENEVEGIVIAFCWVHVRRDFIKCGRYTKGNRGWALQYLRLIRKIFHTNKQRLQNVDKPQVYIEKDEKLRQLLIQLREMSQVELSDDSLKIARRKILESLDRHWQGLNVFVENPHIPMDNNLVERKFRVVARFRHNCYGVFSEKFGQITARILSILATLEVCGIDIRKYLKLYFREVALSGGNAPAPEVLKELLPWADELQERLKKHSDRHNDTS